MPYVVKAIGSLVVSVLDTGPNIRGFKPGRKRWIFKGDKNPLFQCRKTSRHFKNPTNMKEKLRWQNSMSIFGMVSPASLLDAFDDNCQTYLMNGSGMIRKANGDAQ
jgi:hypothetical protein